MTLLTLIVAVVALIIGGISDLPLRVDREIQADDGHRREGG